MGHSNRNADGGYGDCYRGSHYAYAYTNLGRGELDMVRAARGHVDEAAADTLDQHFIGHLELEHVVDLADAIPVIAGASREPAMPRRTRDGMSAGPCLRQTKQRVARQSLEGSLRRGDSGQCPPLWTAAWSFY